MQRRWDTPEGFADYVAALHAQSEPETPRPAGWDPVLVTCDVDNLASRRVIQANRGVLEDERGGMLRFWIPTDT